MGSKDIGFWYSTKDTLKMKKNTLRPLVGCKVPRQRTQCEVKTMPKKAKTNNSEAPQGVDYAAYIKRLGTLPALLEEEPNARLEMAVEDVLQGEANGHDDKLMKQLINTVKTTVAIHGSDEHKKAVPDRVRSADPMRQAHYDGLDAAMSKLVEQSDALVSVMVDLGFGMRVKKGENDEPLPFTKAQLLEGLNKKNHEANPYRPHSNNTEGQAEVEG